MAGGSGLKGDPNPALVVLAISLMAWLVGGVLGAWEVVGSRLSWWRLPDPAGPLRPLPGGWVWAWNLTFIPAVVMAILGCRRWWQRGVLATSAVGVTLGWWPVLWLCGWQVDMTLPLVSLLWAAVGAWIYAARHPAG